MKQKESFKKRKYFKKEEFEDVYHYLSNAIEAQNKSNIIDTLILDYSMKLTDEYCKEAHSQKEINKEKFIENLKK